MTLQDYIVDENSTILETINKINTNLSKTAFLCSDGKLIAAVSDGDIRRALLNGYETSASVRKIANYNPVSLEISEKAKAQDVLLSRKIDAVPIVDEAKRVVDVITFSKSGIKGSYNVNVPVVIMAGGKGTRLKPYTDILPKPLIPIGEKTITEHIMDKFADMGCKDFYMIVNYKKEFIKAYFHDVADDEGSMIPRFIEEKNFLGTGGGISLLADDIDSTFFLTNCDILVDADYEKALEKHKKEKNILTIICAQKRLTIPYGTVETDENGQILELKEKPIYEMITNTGFYIVEPEFVRKVPRDTKVDITDVITDCIKSGERIGTFIVDDSAWMDMGQFEEMDKMKEKMGIK